jgi:hypothetical protein
LKWGIKKITVNKKWGLQMSVKFNELLYQIEECRSQMIVLALQSSFENEKVIQLSTKLDQLLNKYQYVKND